MTREAGILRTEGVILNSFRLRDADRMVVLFTREEGKIKAVMKSVSKPRNRFAANTEMGCLVDGRFHFRSHQAETGRVVELCVKDPFSSLRQGIERIMVLSYALNLVEETWPWHDPHPEFYALFKSLLTALDAEDDPGRVRALLRVFEMRLLYFLGIHPGLENCGHCGSLPEWPAILDLRTMSVVCGRCGGRSVRSSTGKVWTLELTRGFVRFYREALAQAGAVEPVEMSAQTDGQARFFFRSIFLNYLGRKLKVLEVREDL